MSHPRTATSIESDADIIEFASLDFRGQRFEVLQAYYSNLFDLWEFTPDLSNYADQKLAHQRWAVQEYAGKKFKRLEFDRDFCATGGNSWYAVHDGKALTGAMFA